MSKNLNPVDPLNTGIAKPVAQVHLKEVNIRRRIFYIKHQFVWFNRCDEIFDIKVLEINC